jgi:hypothetical protein
MVADLINAKGGAKLYTIKGMFGFKHLRPCDSDHDRCYPGGQGYISVVPTTASVCNRVFFQFLSRLPKARSKLRPPRDPLEVYISKGLGILAELAGDPSIAERDPLSPMSFSRLPAAVERLQVENYMGAAKDARKAFSPLGSDGRPMRK